MLVDQQGQALARACRRTWPPSPHAAETEMPQIDLLPHQNPTHVIRDEPSSVRPVSPVDVDQPCLEEE
jgi:hypothetical protein